MLRRMLVERMEHRILLGTTAFLGVMVLVGWIAINEGGRMASFDREFLARSIERGGGLFISNCATCHGPDARGSLGKAPGLNNPQLFGHDFFADLKAEAKSLTEEQTKLLAELSDPATTDARKAEINVRLGTGSIAEAILALQPSPLMQAAAPKPEATAEATGTAEATAEGTAGATEAAAATEAATATPTATATATPEATATSEATATAEATAESTPSAEATTEATAGGTASGAAATQAVGGDLASLQAEQTSLQTEKTTLQTELNDAATTDARKAEINTRLTAIDARLGTGSIPADVLAMEATDAQRVSQMQPAVQNGYDPAAPDRLVNTKWTGGLRNFIHGTLVGGRPVSSAYWPDPMPNWSQVSGGPLREDQIEDVINFIVNFDKGDQWTIEDLNAVNQFAIEPGKAPVVVPAIPDAACASCTADNLPQVITAVAGVTGDPVNGQSLYTSLGCAACHELTTTGPATVGTWTRIQDIRLKDPALAGLTGEEYIIHSILLPSEYVVPTFSDNVMPHEFGNKITTQQLADLVAFLKTQDQPAS